MSESNKIFSSHRNLEIQQLIYEVITKWKVIVATVLIFVISTVLYTVLFVTPKYTSVAKIIIFNKSETNSAQDLEFSTSTYLTRDFAEIIVDKRILNTVSEKLNNEYSVSQLKSFISINNPQNTRVIEIIANTPDAKDSKRIVDAVCDVAGDEMVDLMGLDRINIISYGDVAKKPSSPNTTSNALLALFFGFIAGLLIVIVLFITDNKVSTEEDLEKYFGISLLATIPFNNKSRTSKGK